MTCYLPFKNRNLDILFYAFRPTVAIVDEVVEALTKLCVYTESLGCLHSSILKSIHGNMVIWYGSWVKTSAESRESLNSTLLSMLSNISSVAILIDQSYFDAYGGESRDGSTAAKFSTGDTVSLSSTILSPKNEKSNIDISYACLAIFKSRFQKMEGAIAGVCLKSETKSRVLNVYVWKQLHSCYSWILNSDYRKAVLPYLDGLSLNVKYDIFKVVHVRDTDNLLYHQYYQPHRMLASGQVESKGPQIYNNNLEHPH